MLAITRLDMVSRRATCWPVVDGNLDCESTVATQIKKLIKQEEKPSLTSFEQKMLLDLHKNSIAETLQQLGTDLAYRKEHRKVQLLSAIASEVDSALNKRQRNHTNFNLGLCTLDVDSSLLGMDIPSGKTTTRFGYKKTVLPLANLDPLLGDRWDVHQCDTILTFVTSLNIQINKKLCLVGSVYTATHNGLAEGDYRTKLSRHMVNVDEALEQENPV